MDASEVRIRRHGQAIILEPVPEDWLWLDAIAGTMSEDFMGDGREQPAQQERSGLDGLFA